MVSKFDKTSELYNQSGDVEQGAAGLEDIVQHYSGNITHSNHYLLLQIYYTLAEILKKKYTAKTRKQPKKKSQGQVKQKKTSSEIELVLRVLQIRAECADALLPRYHPVKAEIYRQMHFWLRQAQRFGVSIPPKATPPPPPTETAASVHALVEELNEFHKLALLNERVCFGENHDQKKGAAE